MELEMKTVTIRYFASIREALGTGSESLQTPVVTVGALREQLMSRSDAAAQVLAAGKAVRMALNQEICDGDAVLGDGDEVAFFPPVTGG